MLNHERYKIFSASALLAQAITQLQTALRTNAVTLEKLQAMIAAARDAAHQLRSAGGTHPRVLQVVTQLDAFAGAYELRLARMS